MKDTNKKIEKIQTECFPRIGNEGFVYNTTIFIEKADGTAIEYTTQEPMHLNQNFENVSTIEDFYAVLGKMSIAEKQEDYYRLTLGIENINDIVSVTVKVYEVPCNDYDDTQIIESFLTGTVGYDFVNKKAL